MKIIKLKTTTSTQDEIEKYVGGDEDAVVFSEIQTGGRGTKNRTFVSDIGGVYATFYIRHKNLAAERGFDVCKHLSLAVVKTLRDIGVAAAIKWPNDIYANGKKICGMLIKNRFVDGKIAYTVTGIGINVNNDIRDEIKDIAISCKTILEKTVSVEAVFDALVENVYSETDLSLYEKYSCVSGKTVTVIRGKESFKAAVEKILPDGRLQLESGEILSSEEISLRI